MCFKRYEDDDDVPGCTGQPDGDDDYCVDPDDIPLELTYEGNNYDPTSAFPLGLCEGDCDGDSGELLFSVRYWRVAW